ncbi:unnamed protein product [Zymoseptoria tritici ST99CH_1E4]|uniref:Uncharacterized protein n=1 Tax=Zymoseptoria tritici ST99CH_1E4 TaxID=1276532 RepID=A0A2H1GZ73_ZYMTR|nr:unnamed protein product [Zymoseptoria tritici ST99CH_1E4]
METSMDANVLAKEYVKQVFTKDMNMKIKFFRYFFYYLFAFAREFGMAICDVTIQGFLVFAVINLCIPAVLKEFRDMYHPILVHRGHQASNIYHVDTACGLAAAGIAILFSIYWSWSVRRIMSNNRLLPAFRTYIAWIASSSGGLVAVHQVLDVFDLHKIDIFDLSKSIAENFLEVQYTRGCFSFEYLLNLVLEHGLCMYAILFASMLFNFFMVEHQKLYNDAIHKLVLSGPEICRLLLRQDIALRKEDLQLVSSAAKAGSKKHAP